MCVCNNHVFICILNKEYVIALINHALRTGVLPKHHMLFQIIKLLDRAYFPSTRSFYDAFPGLAECLHTLKYKFGGGPIEMLRGSSVPQDVVRDRYSILRNMNLPIPSPFSPSMTTTYNFDDDTPDYAYLKLILSVVRVYVESQQLHYFQYGSVKSVMSTLGCDETLLVKGLQFDNLNKVVVGAEEPRLIDEKMVANEEQQWELESKMVPENFLSKVLVFGIEMSGTKFALSLPLSYRWRSLSSKTTLEEDVNRARKFASTCWECLIQGPNIADQCEFLECPECLTNKKLCFTCEHDLGLNHWYPALRPCIRCLRHGKECFHLHMSFLTMDNDAAQLNLQQKLSTEMIDAHTAGHMSFDANKDDPSPTMHPFGEGAHNVKAALNSTRHPMWIVLDERIWLASTTLMLELYTSSNRAISRAISRHLPPNKLLFADKHDPMNVTLYTKKEVIDAVPSEMLCGTLLPLVQAYDNKEKHFNKPRLIAANVDTAVVLDSIGIHFVNLRFHSTIVNTIKHDKFTEQTTGIVMVPIVGAKRQRLKTLCLCANGSDVIKCFKFGRTGRTKAVEVQLNFPPEAQLTNIKYFAFGQAFVVAASDLKLYVMRSWRKGKQKGSITWEHTDEISVVGETFKSVRKILALAANGDSVAVAVFDIRENCVVVNTYNLSTGAVSTNSRFVMKPFNITSDTVSLAWQQQSVSVLVSFNQHIFSYDTSANTTSDVVVTATTANGRLTGASDNKKLQGGRLVDSTIGTIGAMTVIGSSVLFVDPTFDALRYITSGAALKSLLQIVGRYASCWGLSDDDAIEHNA